MTLYSVRGFSAATAATVDHAIFAIWNPDTLRRIKILELGVFKGGAGAANDSIYVSRITSRGTAGSTQTPDADNSWEADDVPPSGFLLDLSAYSAQPTRAAAPFMFGWVAAAVAGSGLIWPTPRGITIPGAAGLAVCQRVATAWPASEVYAVVED